MLGIVTNGSCIRLVVKVRFIMYPLCCLSAALKWYRGDSDVRVSMGMEDSLHSFMLLSCTEPLPLYPALVLGGCILGTSVFVVYAVEVLMHLATALYDCMNIGSEGSSIWR